MVPTDIDPTLRSASLLDTLDDGYSAPMDEDPDFELDALPAAALEALSEQSLF